MITRPVRERSIETIGAMVENGIRKSGFEEVGLLSLSSADHTEIGEVAKDLADRYEGIQRLALAALHPRRRLQHHPGQRVLPQRPPLRADLRPRGRQRADAQGDQQDGHRGGPDPHRRCGVLPRLAAGEALLHGRPAHRDRRGRPAGRRAGQGVIAKGREVTGKNDIRCTVSIGGFVPKPHTPFQWAAQLDARDHRRPAEELRDVVREDKRYGRAIGFRYHDGKPGIVEGLLSRGDRRVGAVIEQVWRDGGRFDGWSEHFSFDRWIAGRRGRPRRHRRRPRLVHHPRARLRRGAALGPPRLRPRQGLAVGRLGGRPRRRRRHSDVEVEDCRWTPCYDCGVCPEMGTEIQIGPTGQRLLPLAVV